jgi:hypothetical protein
MASGSSASRKRDVPYYLLRRRYEMTYYTMTEVAHMLGVKYYQVAYQHKIGELDEPIKVGGRRAYTSDDVRRVAEHFNVPIPVHGPGDRGGT